MIGGFFLKLEYAHKKLLTEAVDKSVSNLMTRFLKPHICYNFFKLTNFYTKAFRINISITYIEHLTLKELRLTCHSLTNRQKRACV